MPSYVFEAMDSRGQKVRKEVEASSRDEAIRQIRRMGLHPTAIKQRGAGGGGGGATSGRSSSRAAARSARTSARTSGRQKRAAAAAETGGEKKKKPLVFGGVKLSELTHFTTQLATLQDAGLPLVRSLKILEGQLKPSPLKYMLAEVAEDVESGSTLSDALAKHPKAFDRLYVNMVKAGEAGGVLDTILERLAEFMEKSLKLRKKVVGAMIYPIVVITVAGLILGGIMTFVVPKFLDMFEEMPNVEVPWPTLMLKSISDFIGSYFLVLIALPFVIWAIIKAIGRTEGGRMAIDRFKLAMPLFGTIISKSTIARFCRTLGTLVASGVPILEALNIVKETTGNAVVTRAVDDVHNSIREGESIARPLAASGVFDDIIVNMVDIGEETGELDKMLVKVADNYESDVDVAVESLTSIMEPLLIVFLGGAVGFIVVALFLPLISILEGIQ
ncbi:MAG: type II secretion system F family protein [Planctomycetota bacterium]|nr:MAG: type II secretion system F family protein [Planctomycetota bacterium]